jgi:hypothetical protein
MRCVIEDTADIASKTKRRSVSGESADREAESKLADYYCDCFMQAMLSTLRD